MNEYLWSKIEQSSRLRLVARIRSFGFLANAAKAKKMPLIQKQLNYSPQQPREKKDTATFMLELTGRDITLCPACKQGQLKRIADLPSLLTRALFDTS